MGSAYPFCHKIHGLTLTIIERNRVMHLCTGLDDEPLAVFEKHGSFWRYRQPSTRFVSVCFDSLGAAVTGYKNWARLK